MKEIKFYRTADPYGEFSNFYYSPIIIAALIWPTVEHYFQANKFDDFRLRDKIRMINSPMDVAREGRNRNYPLRPDWENVKDSIMHKAVKTKFLQHPDLKALLLKTGDAVIIEHTVNDNYWADGGDGTGKNMLGKILMQVRNELSAISDDADLIFPPWIAFPAIDTADMFWRMGRGETYLQDLHNYITIYGKKRYMAEYPTPVEWEYFYSGIK